MASSDLEVQIPRDRVGSFEPQLVGKYQRRLPGFDDKIISLYARGMTVREIQSHIQEIYQADKTHPTVGAMWERNWAEIIPFLAYPDYIRKAIYTTNTIESINYGIRKVIKNRTIFPDDKAAFKLVYFALNNLAKLEQANFQLERGAPSICYHLRRTYHGSILMKCYLYKIPDMLPLIFSFIVLKLFAVLFRRLYVPRINLLQ